MGLWFMREVKIPSDGTVSMHKTEGLELIWCPGNQKDFSRCRVSTVAEEGWIKQFNGGGRGAVTGRGAAPAAKADEEEPAALRDSDDEEEEDDGEDEEEEPAPRRTHTDLIKVDGKKLSRLGGGSIAKLWRWNGKQVIIFRYSGQRTAGKLMSVNETGIELAERDGLIAWKGVLSIGLAP